MIMVVDVQDMIDESFNMLSVYQSREMVMSEETTGTGDAVLTEERTALVATTILNEEQVCSPG